MANKNNNKTLRLSKKVQTLLEQNLKNEEELLWYGQPVQGIISYPIDSYIIPFSVIWGGGSLIWEIVIVYVFIMSSDLMHFFLMLGGFPFVILGLHMIFGRYILDKKQRENIYYGITNRRIIVIQGKKRSNISSFLISRLSNITIIEKQNNRGTILFSKRQPFDSFFARGLMPRKMFSSERFEMIDNVSDVYNKIIEIQQKM